MKSLVVAITLLTGLTITLAGCGSARPARTGPGVISRRTSSPTSTVPVGPQLAGGPSVSGAGGKFAGYVYQGDVHSIGASWQVPTVAANSRLGKASTWIGAQAPGSTDAPFIQIGTQEEMRANRVKGRPAVRFYEAFFSDAQRAFHPYSLFAVHAGDQVTAAMKLIDQRWYLNIIDMTTGASDHFSTAEEGTGQFNYGLWLQEDVTDTNINVAFPYPDVSAARISALTVNATRPTSGQLLSTWMSLPGGYLGPTALSNGGFSVIPQSLSAAGARYLSIARQADANASRFENEVDNWATSTSQAVVTHQTDAFVAELKRTVTELRAVSWPATVANLMRKVEFNDDVVVMSLQTVATGGVVGVYRALTGLESKLGDQADTRLIRRALNVEQLAY